MLDPILIILFPSSSLFNFQPFFFSGSWNKISVLQVPLIWSSPSVSGGYLLLQPGWEVVQLQCIITKTVHVTAFLAVLGLLKEALLRGLVQILFFLVEAVLQIVSQIYTAVPVSIDSVEVF